MNKNLFIQQHNKKAFEKSRNLLNPFKASLYLDYT